MSPTLIALGLLVIVGEPAPPPVVHGVRMVATTTTPTRDVAPLPGEPTLTRVRAHAYFPAPKILSRYSQ